MHSCYVKKNKAIRLPGVANEDVAPPKILQNAETENQCKLAEKKHKVIDKTIPKNKASTLLYILIQKCT